MSNLLLQVIGYHQRGGQLEIVVGERELEVVRGAGAETGHDQVAVILLEVPDHVLRAMNGHQLQRHTEIEGQPVGHLHIESDDHSPCVDIGKGEVVGEIPDPDDSGLADALEAGLPLEELPRVWTGLVEDGGGSGLGDHLHTRNHPTLVLALAEHPSEIAAGGHDTGGDEHAGHGDGCNGAAPIESCRGRSRQLR